MICHIYSLRIKHINHILNVTSLVIDYMHFLFQVISQIHAVGRRVSTFPYIIDKLMQIILSVGIKFEVESKQRRHVQNYLVHACI